MEKYLCEFCNKSHAFITSIELLEPDIISDMSSEEKVRRLKRIGDNYLIDKTVFLAPANLFIRILESIDFFHWRVWVKVDPNEFIEMTENLGLEVSTINGMLYLPIPFYLNSDVKEVKLNYYLNTKNKLAEVEILESDSELSNDFANGISKEKLISWMTEYYHPNQSKK